MPRDPQGKVRAKFGRDGERWPKAVVCVTHARHGPSIVELGPQLQMRPFVGLFFQVMALTRSHVLPVAHASSTQQDGWQEQQRKGERLPI